MKKFNESELLKMSKEQVSCLNNLTKEKEILRDIYTDSLPCWIHVNNFNDLSLDYFNNTALENFQESMDDIKKEGIAFLYRVIHSETGKVAVPLLQDAIKSGDYSKVIFFEQRIKYTRAVEYRNHLSFSIMNKPLNSFLTVTFPIGLLEDFVKKRLFKNTETFDSYYERFLSLTNREREVLKYIVLGKTNKQIGEISCVSEFTVKTHRRNIFQKLQTSNITDLTKVAVYFNLIDKF